MKNRFLLAAIPLYSSLAAGATVEWTGSASSAWSAGSNWSTSAAPSAGDFLVFTQGAPANPPSNNDIAGLSVGSLAFVNSTFTAPLTLGGDALTLSGPSTVAGATINRPASGTTATVTSTAHGLATGQFITVSGGSTANLNAISPITVTDANTFTYTSAGTGEVVAGTGNFTLHAVSNANITANRTVTIGNNITVSGSQTWSTANDVDAVTILNGNLTDSGNITLGTAVDSNGTNLPTLRLGGNNSGYTGTITPGANSGVLLLSPSAQTGGLVDLNANNRNLWLSSNTSTNPYTFWTGSSTPTGGNPMNVNFRNAGSSGLFLTGGDVHWNPVSSGNHYQWDASRAGSFGEIRINGSNDATATGNPPAPVPDSFLSAPRTLYFGNSSGSLVLGGNRSFTNGGGGSNPSRVVMNFALSDDGTARSFTTSASLMVLTRAAGGGTGTPALTGDMIVSGGALAVTQMDRIFNGWLNLNGGVILLDGVSWSNFMSDRSGGYRASTGAADVWGINNGGGFAARTNPINIFISGNAGDSYGTITAGAVFNRDFTLGAGARADDKSLYANAAITISQDTVLSAARTVRLNGGNREHFGNWTIQGPVHEFSGSITGGQILNIGGGTAVTSGGTLRLSNTGNSFSAININPSGLSLAGGTVVLATDDAALGGGTVTIGSGNQGQAGLLLFENQAGGQKTFAKNLTIAMGADNSSGDSGFGSYAGDVLYTGTATITGSRATLPFQIQSGKFTFGSGSSLTNNSTGGIQSYSKGGAGELVLDNNLTYGGTNTNLTWSLREGTLTTARAGVLVNGTGTFDGDNLIGNDTVTWLTNTNGLLGQTPVSRTWKVTSVDQAYASGSMSYTGFTTVDVEAGRTLTLTASGSTSPTEALGNANTTPRWDLVKSGGGTWVFSNTDLSNPAGSGPGNGGGFIRVDAGTLDITGDFGRGSLSVNGGTLLSGSYSPFTYGTSASQFTTGVTQSNLLEVTTAGGKIGISASASTNVTRSVGFHWDQSGTSTLTLASRDNLDLIFATAANFPNVQSGNTLAITRDGTGSGKVQINDTAVTVSGTLTGDGELRMGAAGAGSLTLAGSVAPGMGVGALNLTGAIAISGTLVVDVSAATADQLNTASTNLDLTGATIDFDVAAAPNAASYVLVSYSGTLTGNTNPASDDTFALVSGLPAGYSIVHDTVLKQIRIEASGGTPYDTWAAGTFSQPFTNTAPGVDFDNDGFENLLEFVLGTDPTISQPGTGPVVTSASGNDLVISFPRSDVSETQPTTVKVQVSNDLSVWAPGDEIVIGPGPAGTGPNGASYTVDDSGSIDTVVVTIPKASAASKFARVVASQ